MKSTLKIKNFGPIKEVDLDLRNVNVFIGPQASGKSAIAKLFTIFKAPRKSLYRNISDKNGNLVIDNEQATKKFPEILEEYNIRSFLKEDTEILFDSELHTISYVNGKLDYEPKLYQRIENIKELAKDFDLNVSTLKQDFCSLHNFYSFKSKADQLLYGNDNKKNQSPYLVSFDYYKKLNSSNCLSLINIIKEIEIKISAYSMMYIPSERMFINVIRKYSLNLLLNKVPIPRHILTFGAELEKSNLHEIDLGFLADGLTYKVINGVERIFFDSVNSILLTEASSGIQSVVPLLATILASKDNDKNDSFVIEEPELNLSPDAQYDLLKFLEKNKDYLNEDYETTHTFITHSPYILSGLNNFLYADKVKWHLNNDVDDIESLTGWCDMLINAGIVRKIVAADFNQQSFSAYQIADGVAMSILDREIGLIADNFIDKASDKINDDFDALMNLKKSRPN